MTEPPASDRVRVLYVGGWGRSGSTLLELMIGQLRDVFSAGEIREIWNSGCREDRPCGCRLPFSRCPFWRAVGDKAFGGWGAIDLDDILRLRYSIDRPWRIPGLATQGFTEEASSDVRRYMSILERLYRAIRDVSAAKVIVDSSNLPSHAFLLRGMEAIDLRLVHLVRDSRGVAFSWQRTVRKESASGEHKELPRYGSVTSSIRWLGYNALTRALGRSRVPYLFVRYEDVVAAPREYVARIGLHAGVAVDEDDVSFIDAAEVVLRPNHTVEGNPMRLGAERLVLRCDETWKREMPTMDRVVVTLLTLPSLLRYGYDVSPGRAA